MKLAIALFLFSSLSLAFDKCIDLFTSEHVVVRKNNDLAQSKSPLFNAAFNSVIQLEIQADFSAIKKVSKKYEQESPRNLPEFYNPGTLVDLSNPGRIIPIDLRPRGNTSLEKGESQFPKLKLEINDNEDLSETAFKGARNFRINTHVSTNPKTRSTKRGRLNNENSPLLEGVAFELARNLDLVTPATRVASIHYIDAKTKQEFTRNALLIETDKKTAERLKSNIVDEQHIDKEQAALFLTFHKLIGNEDVQLKVHEPDDVAQTAKYRTLWNTYVLENLEGRRKPVVYDLDLATFITGYKPEVAATFVNQSFGLTNPTEAIFVTRFLKLRQKLTHLELTKAIEFIKSRKEALYQTIQQAVLTEPSRKQALKQLDLFFNTVDTIMSLKVLASKDVHFYKDANKSEEKMKVTIEDDEPGALRPGTPIKILGEENGMLKVAIIDIHHDMADGENEIGYIEKSALIQAALPDKLIGLVYGWDLY